MTDESKEPVSKIGLGILVVILTILTLSGIMYYLLIAFKPPTKLEFDKNSPIGYTIRFYPNDTIVETYHSVHRPTTNSGGQGVYFTEVETGAEMFLSGDFSITPYEQP
jgi:ABC-type glycerol-3-phosphate transport system permease component